MVKQICPHGKGVGGADHQECLVCEKMDHIDERRSKWAERGPALLAAAKEALDRLEAITLMGMSEYGGDGSAGFYKMRAYDAITTASRGVRGLVAAIAACEEIDHE